MSIYGYAQNINTPIEMLADRMKLQPRPVMILVSTDWCLYCQMQKAQLLKNKTLIAAKNEIYYSELDAEAKKDISFNGRIYHYKNFGNARGLHELVIALADKQEGFSYPFWIILDKDYNVLVRRNGLLAPNEVNKIVEILIKTGR